MEAIIVTSTLALFVCLMFYLRIREHRKLIKAAKALKDSHQRFGDKLTELEELLADDIEDQTK